MRTPVFRRRAAKSFDAALRLVFSEVDQALDQQSTTKSASPDLLAARIMEGVCEEGEDFASVRLAKKIVERLKAVDLLSLGTGAVLRHRDLLLETVGNHIRQAATVGEITHRRDEAMAASRKAYVRSPDWPDYLRALALILNIIADIWEFWDHFM